MRRRSGGIDRAAGAERGERLIRSTYKKTRRHHPFVPALQNAHPKQQKRPAHALYVGYEEFPSPEALREAVFEWRTRLHSHMGKAN